jgi:branched-chain amino acid transport system substrate-binding protein
MITLRRSIVIAGALLAFAAPLAARAADPLEIPTTLPLTGPAAFLGKEYGDTLKLLEERVNKSGGVGGRPIHFAIQDDQTSPQVDVQLTTAALAKKPPLIIDGAPLALCRATAPLLQSSGPLMWCLSPSIRPDPGTFVIGVMASTRDSMIAGMNYFRGRGFKKIAILNSTDATGADADAILAELIKTPAYAGMSYAAQEHFNATDLSVAAQIARIKQSGAQALIGFTTGTPVATVLRGMADGGLDLPVFTSQGNMSIAQLDGYKAFAPKELLFPGYAALAPDSVNDKGVREKVAGFRADMKAANMTPDLLHATPWDTVFLIVEAFKRAGPNATSEQLRSALAGVRNWPGVFGRYDFPASPNRGLGVNWIIVSKWEPARSTWVAVSTGGGEPLK